MVHAHGYFRNGLIKKRQNGLLKIDNRIFNFASDVTRRPNASLENDGHAVGLYDLHLKCRVSRVNGIERSSLVRVYNNTYCCLK